MHYQAAGRAHHPAHRFVISLILLAATFCVFCAGAAGTSSAFAAEIKTSLKDQQSVSLTVYNENLALIRDVRNVRLTSGLNNIAVRGVSALIRPETAIMSSTSHPNSLSLLEQNFDYDLLTPEKLLQKYLGKQVKVIEVHPTTGVEVKESTATVLSINNGVILRIGNRIETGTPGRIVYDQVPDNLRDRPTLSVLAKSAVDGKQTLELSYLSSGLSWRADYVARLDADEKFLDMNGWVTLDNQSGASYKNARLQVVAGAVNRVRPSRSERSFYLAEATVALRAVQSEVMLEESLFEYHLYTLGHKTDVLENQTKQVALLAASRVPIKKEYVLWYDRSRLSDSKVSVIVKVENKEENNLGIALPKGIIRVYKNDSTDSSQFIGEDNIDHTPKNETIRLKLGNTFDITAKRKETEYESHPKKKNKKKSYRATYEVEIHNAKNEDIAVRVLDRFPGNSRITNSSIPYTKPDAFSAKWLVEVPAGQRTTLRYGVWVVQ